MTKVEVEPQETVKVIGRGEFEPNGDLNGKPAGIFYVRGEGANYAMAKRPQYLSDESYQFPDTTSLTIGLEKAKDDALYVKNLSPTNTLEFYFDKQDFILDSLNVGGQKSNSTQVAQVSEQNLQADGSVAQRIEIDLTEYSRSTVEFFMSHDSAVDVTIEASNNPQGDGWFEIDTSTGVNKYHEGWANAFRYIAMEVSAGSVGDVVNMIINGAK